MAPMTRSRSGEERVPGPLVGDYYRQRASAGLIVSEATVVRFVGQLGYGGYGAFLQALRDFVDSGMTLPDRADLPGMKGPGTDVLHRVVFEEMDNLRQFYESLSQTIG